MKLYQFQDKGNHQKSLQSTLQYLVILDNFGEDGTFHGHGGNDVKHLVEHR